MASRSREWKVRLRENDPDRYYAMMREQKRRERERLTAKGMTASGKPMTADGWRRRQIGLVARGRCPDACTCYDCNGFSSAPTLPRVMRFVGV